MAGSALLPAASFGGFVGPVEFPVAPDFSQSPAASNDFVAWTQSPSFDLGPENVMVQPRTGGPARVVSKGEISWAGGFAGDRLVLNENISRQHRGRGARVVIYDAAAQTRTKVWGGLEGFAHGLAGNWILFTPATRSHPYESEKQISLFNIRTKRVIKVARATRGRGTPKLYPGRLAGHWVVYRRCREICRVIRYDRLTSERTVIGPGGDPAVTRDGTVYWSQGGGLVRWEDGTTSLVGPSEGCAHSDPNATKTDDGVELLYSRAEIHQGECDGQRREIWGMLDTSP